MSQISSEVERLNNVMRIKVEELNEVHGKLRQLGNENDQLKNRIRESEDMNRQLP